MAEHKDLEFSVDDAQGHEKIFKDFDKACGFAVSLSASTGQTKFVDVLIYSKAAAHVWGGDEAVENYMEDPEASVSDRIKIDAQAIGRVA